MIEAAKGKESRSSLVSLTNRDKMLELSRRGNEKLGVEGSVAMRAERKAIGSSSVVEIEEGKMLEQSGAGNEELMAEVSKVLKTKEKGSSSSWVVEMQMARWKQHCIHRVPEFIKKMTNRDAYQPQLMSLGPLHHGEPHLLPMEEHKGRAVLHMVNWVGKPLTEFVAAIEEVADELEAAYDGLDDRWRGVNRCRFVQMMVTDGCFLLELMRIQQSLYADGGLDAGYAANDPVFSRHSFFSLWPIMKNDMIAMENQIPLVVLQRILFVAFEGTTPPVKLRICFHHSLMMLDSYPARC